MQHWCERRGRQPGAILPLSTAWALARGWYTDRLSSSWRRRTPDEIRAFFQGLGLTGPFWAL